MKLPIEAVQSLNRAFSATESRLAAQAAEAGERAKTLTEQLEAASALVAELRSAHEATQSRLALLQQAVATRDEEIARLRIEVIDGDAELAEAQDKVQALLAEQAQVAPQLAAARQALEASQQRVAELDALASERAGWLSQALAAATAKDDELVAMRQSAAQAHTRADTLADALADAQARSLHTLHEAAQSAERQADAAKQAQARVEQQLADAWQAAAASAAQLSAAQTELVQLRQQWAQARDLADLHARERDEAAATALRQREELTEAVRQARDALRAAEQERDAVAQAAAREAEALAQRAREHEARRLEAEHSLSGLHAVHDETLQRLAAAETRLDTERAALPALQHRIDALQQQLAQSASDMSSITAASRQQVEELRDQLARSGQDAASAAAASQQTIDALQRDFAAAQALGQHYAAEWSRLHAHLLRLQRSRLWPLFRRLAGAAAADLPATGPTTLPSMPVPPSFPQGPSQVGANDNDSLASEFPMTTNTTLSHSSAAPAGGDTLESLLVRHDQDFVDSSYRAILRRPADPQGREFYLTRLRAGAPKLQLLVELSESPEARRAGPPLAGLHAASRRLRWTRVPVLGRLVRALFGTESAAETQARLRAIEQQIARVARQEGMLLDRIGKAVGETASRVQALREPDIARIPARTRNPAPVFFTICSKNFTAYARTLHGSLIQHHPGATFYMFLCDGPDERFDVNSLPFTVVTLSQLDIPDVQGMAERYNITEFNTAIKPFAFQYLFKVRAAEEVVYLDPDIFVTSPMQEVIDGFRDGADCLLTPHILNPAEGAEVSDDKLLLFGIYNLGFIALRRTPRVQQIVEWWGRRLERECVIALEKGLFVDQKWADLFPAFIPRTLVLRHAGYNVAYWNVPQRTITCRSGAWMANDEPLRFAHFSGNKLDDPSVYSRHSWTLNASNIGELKTLLDIYRDTVYANGHAQYSKLPYAYNWNGSSGVNLHTPKPAHESTEPAATAVATQDVPPQGGGDLPNVEALVPSAEADTPGEIVLTDERLAPLPKIFVTDWSTPRPDQDAGSVTTFFLLKILAQLGYDVTFVPSDLEPLGEYTDAVRRLGVRCLHRDDVGSIPEFLAREGASFRAFILFRAPIAALYLADIRRTAPQAKVVLETVDLHYLRDERAAQADGSPTAIENARLAKAWELGIIEGCDVSIVLSSFEQELLEKEVPGADIRTMPLLFLDMPGPSGRGFHERANMLFIGGFRHLPNVDAVTWFCRDIWPRVRERLPEARFQIVGSHPPQEVLDLGQMAGVDVLGHVKHLDDVFDKVRLSVTPLRYGAGIKGKVATSLGYGVPVVGTGLTFEGMELRHERHVLVADDADSFVDAVVRGYTDEALWTRMSQDGFERVNALYSEAAGRERVEALMDSLAVKGSDFQFHTFRSQSQYVQHRRTHEREYQRRQRAEIDLIERGVDSFFVKGWCAVCGCATDFQVGFMYSYQTTDDGLPIPNWREHLNCMKCGHTTRVRLMVHLIDQVLRPEADARIYISEQTTPLYRHLRQHHAQVSGSEYLGDRVALGGEVDGMRNEDLTRLTFPSGSFDLMISCDVLEHVTDDDAAFAECFRCLAPGGRLIFTAPCSLDSARNIIRARVTADGEIEHLITPPEYHGNPVDPENGALCFRYFGWEILDQLRRAGFQDAYALSAWSLSLGYLGVEQIVFVAHKAAA